jgi:hypothetical protein
MPSGLNVDALRGEVAVGGLPGQAAGELAVVWVL